MFTVTRSNQYFIRRLLRLLAALSILAGLCYSNATHSTTAQAVAAAPAQRVTVQHSLQLNQSTTSTQHPQTLTNTTAQNISYYYNWSGYVANATRPYVAVRSVYVQPAVTCTTPGAWTVFWVGFDGYTNNTVEQAGTAAQCAAGKTSPTYYAWWEMYPTNSIQTMPMTIKAGDRVEDTVLYTASNGDYTLSVSDLTNAKQHYTKVTKCAVKTGCARQTAEWIVERPTLANGTYASLADWKSMQLTTDVAANVTALDPRTKIVAPLLKPVSAFPNTAIDMVNDPYTSEALANVSPLTSTGSVFSDTWAAAH